MNIHRLLSTVEFTCVTTASYKARCNRRHVRSEGLCHYYCCERRTRPTQTRSGVKFAATVARNESYSRPVAIHLEQRVAFIVPLYSAHKNNQNSAFRDLSTINPISGTELSSNRTPNGVGSRFYTLVAMYRVSREFWTAVIQGMTATPFICTQPLHREPQQRRGQLNRGKIQIPLLRKKSSVESSTR